MAEHYPDPREPQCDAARGVMVFRAGLAVERRTGAGGHPRSHPQYAFSHQQAIRAPAIQL
jgi:hypothetical protein